MRRIPIPVVALLLATACRSEGPGPPPDDLPADVAQRGADLVRTLGCAACHRGVPAAGPPATGPPLGLPNGHDPAFVFSYLLDPAAEGVAAAGPRMPSFHLSEAESLALALYLADGGKGAAAARRTPARARRAYRRARARHPEVSAERGRRIFAALNCAGCHPHRDARPWRNGPDLAREATRARPEWLAAWLRAPTAVRPFGYYPGTGGRMPDFALGAAEADSIAAFLLGGRRTGAGDGASGERPSASMAAHTRRKADGLLRDALSCLGCHRWGDDGGRIGPDLTAVAWRRPAAYVRAIVAAPVEVEPGTVMPLVPLPEPDRRLLTARLLEGASTAADEDESESSDLPPGRPPSGPGRGYLSLVAHAPRPPTPGEREGDAREASGAHAYARRCAACHGIEGRADGFNARYLPVSPTPHASPTYMSTRPSSTLFDGVYAGGRILGRSHRMPPFGESLPRERIWDLVAHMRALCRCRGPDWSLDNEEVPARVERAADAGAAATADLEATADGSSPGGSP